MKKRIWIVILLLAVLLPVFTIPASADIGPKPSVVIRFEGLEEERYYVTLLADTKSTGPYSKHDEYNGYGDQEIWEKFNGYSDKDGFNFLSFYSDCTDTDEFRWTYYPPSTFKILIYFPDRKAFAVSANTYERYAFDSYYTADVSDECIPCGLVIGKEIVVRRTYDFTWELVSLLCRIIATIAIEMGVAWLFGFRTRKQIYVIGVTNIVSNTILNIALNITDYAQGAMAFVMLYVVLEFVVFVIEGAVYGARLPRYQSNPAKKVHPWLYAFAANIASFVIGMLVAGWLPGIF